MEGQDSLLEPYKRTRRGDPETSLAAAESVTELTKKQEAVLTVLRASGPSTDEELREAYRAFRMRNIDRLDNRTVDLHSIQPQSDSGLRTRRSELRDRGLVRDSGERRKLESGRMAVVWEVVDL